MYGKHFQSAYTGSMMGAGADVFAVWGYVIAHAVEGHVEINPALLKTVIGMSEKRVQSALDYLCAADPHSRTPDEDGRRMVREGQFLYRVVNHKAYKEIRNQDERREYNRLKKQEERARSKQSSSVNDSQHRQQMSAQSDTYPDTESEPDTSKNKIAPAAREPDLIWEAILEVCGLSDAEPTPTERGAWNKAVKDLKSVKATPLEIRARANAYRRRWKGIELTPMALAKNWNQCVAERAS